mgnify:CR=1 FL=1
MNNENTTEGTGATASAPASGSGCACMGTGPMISELFNRIGPDETTRTHFRNARLEILKGLRHILDQRIADLSATRPSKGSKVVVD